MHLLASHHPHYNINSIRARTWSLNHGFFPQHPGHCLITTALEKDLLRTSLVVQWVKNLPANAGDVGSIPGLRRVSTQRGNWARVPQPLSLCSRACGSRACTSRGCTLQQEQPLQWEAHAPRLESGPHSPQLEKANAHQQRPSTAKNKGKKKKDLLNEIRDQVEPLCSIVCKQGGDGGGGGEGCFLTQ